MFMTTSILLGLLSAFTAAHAAPTDMAKRGNAPEIKVILQGAKVTRVFEQSKTPEYSGKESEGWGNDKERTVPAFTGGKYAMYLTLDVGGPMLYRSKPETFKIQGDKLKAFDFSDQIVDGKLRLPSFKVKEGNTNGSKEVSMECIRKTEGVL